MILSLILFGVILTPKNIKLYYNGAIIEYVGRVHVKKGVNQLYFTGFPKNSMQILKIDAGEGVEVMEYNYIDTLPQKNTRLQNLKMRYDSLLNLKEIISNERSIVLKEQDFLSRMLNYGDDTMMLNPRRLSELLDTIKNKSIYLVKKRLLYEKRLHKIENELKILHDSIYLYLSPTLKMNVFSKSDKYVNVKITAFTGSMFYNLVFEINAQPDKERGIISSFASIKNHTNITFKNVSLTVIMQRYERTTLPDIVPEVYYYPEERYYAKRAARPKMNHYTSVALEAAAPPPSSNPPVKKEYALGEMFKLFGKYTIKRSLMVPVFHDTAEAEFVRKSYPRKYSGVYLFATLKARKYPVYLKNIRVLIDGVYQGKFSYTSREVAYEGDTFTVNFGKDSKVIVKRKKVKDYSTSSWTGAKTRKFKYRITINNLREKPVDVIVYDNVPVIRSDVYKLKHVKITPTGYELNEESGVIKWNLRLNKNEKKELVIYYEISK